VSTDRIGKFAAPKGHCRGCHKLVPKGRRTWCSKACVDAALIKMSPSVARFRVHQRDKGICAKCGFDADKALRILNRLMWGRQGVRPKNSEGYQDLEERDRAITLLVNLWAPRKFPRIGRVWNLPHLWEADHIVAVVEGGGECELENYRTCCIPCHQAETRALAARWARARRETGMVLLASSDTNV
jgi:5-methylcytosine-specific restriction enzyme A